MLELEVFVGKLLAVDAATARAVAFGEIAPLDHEVLDDPVELTTLVPFALGPLGQLDEVLRGLRHGRAEQADFHAFRLVLAQPDVEPHLLNVEASTKVVWATKTKNVCINTAGGGGSARVDDFRKKIESPRRPGGVVFTYDVRDLRSVVRRALGLAAYHRQKNGEHRQRQHGPFHQRHGSAAEWHKTRIRGENDADTGENETREHTGGRTHRRQANTWTTPAATTRLVVKRIRGQTSTVEQSAANAYR